MELFHLHLFMWICLGIFLKLVYVFIKSPARRHIAILAVKMVITVLYPFSSSFYRLLLCSSAKILSVFLFPQCYMHKYETE